MFKDHPPKIVAVTTLLLFFSFSDLAGQQPNRVSPQLSSAWQTSMNWDYYLLNQLAQNSVLTQELQLSDEQQEKIKTAVAELRTEQTEMLKEYREAYQKGNYSEAAASYRKKLTTFQTRFVSRIKETLLDHQTKRLEQISRQQKASYARGSWSSSSRYYGIQDNLDLPVKLAGDLELTEQEVDELKKEIEKNRKEVAEELKRLQDKAMKNVLGKLSAAKRKKLNDLIGEPYDMHAARSSISESYQKKQREKQAGSEKK